MRFWNDCQFIGEQWCVLCDIFGVTKTNYVFEKWWSKLKDRHLCFRKWDLFVNFSKNTLRIVVTNWVLVYGDFALYTIAAYETNQGGGSPNCWEMGQSELQKIDQTVKKCSNIRGNVTRICTSWKQNTLKTSKCNFIFLSRINAAFSCWCLLLLLCGTLAGHLNPFRHHAMTSFFDN